MKLYGRNPVLERLKSNPQTIKSIYLQEDDRDAGYIKGKAKARGIAVYTVPKSKIQKLARNLNNQGILAEIEDFYYYPFSDLISEAKERDQTIIFLDSLNDPQNLGSILRSTACLGGFSIVLPRHNSVEVTESVLRVACGADNFVKVAKVANLTIALSEAKEAGFGIAGTVVKGGEDITQMRLPFPLGLVIGSEERGIRDIIRKHLDLTLSIPMSEERLSLNVAQATAIFCYEIIRQRKTKGLA